MSPEFPSNECLRELIRRDRDRVQMRAILLAGADSSPGPSADAGYFETLRERVRKAGSAAPSL